MQKGDKLERQVNDNAVNRWPPGGVKKPWGVHLSECVCVCVCVCILVCEKGIYTQGEGGREGEREREAHEIHVYFSPASLLT